MSEYNRRKQTKSNAKQATLRTADIPRGPQNEPSPSRQFKDDRTKSDSFWTSPELDDLALTQDPVVMEDIRTLFGAWPGEPDDGFEKLVDDLRSKGEPGHVE